MTRGGNRLAGFLLILGSAFCFSTMGTIVKTAYGEGGSATGLLGARLLIAVPIWALLLNRRLGRLEWSSARIRRLLIAGGVGVGMASLAEYTAYRYLPIALVVLVLFMSPAWVVGVQRYRFGLRTEASVATGLALVASGLLLLTQASIGGVSMTGLALALGASFGIATVFIVVAESMHKVPASVAAAVMAVGAAAVAVPIALIQGTLIETLTSAFLMRSSLLLAVIGTVAGIFLLLRGIRQLGALTASVASAIEPVFAALLAWIFVGEALTGGQMVGGVLIITGSVVVSRREESIGDETVERKFDQGVIGAKGDR